MTPNEPSAAAIAVRDKIISEFAKIKERIDAIEASARKPIYRPSDLFLGRPVDEPLFPRLACRKFVVGRDGSLDMFEETVNYHDCDPASPRGEHHSRYHIAAMCERVWGSGELVVLDTDGCIAVWRVEPKPLKVYWHVFGAEPDEATPELGWTSPCLHGAV